MSDEKTVSYLSVGDKKNTRIAFFLFLGIAVLAFVANYFQLTKPVVAQAILFLALIVAAYIFIRYIGTAYLYELIDEDDNAYLLITRVQGKRHFTQRKIAMNTLCAIIPVNTTNAALRPALPKCHSVNYSAQLLADEYTLLHFDDGNDPVLIRINADETFLSHLAAYLPAQPVAEAESPSADTPPEN